MDTIGKLIPFGYASPNSEERMVALMAAEEQALLIDIRYKPYSRWRPAWGNHALAHRWKARYQWEGNTLGNLNYHNGQMIQLVAPEQGVKRLVQRLVEGQTLVLLCACKEYERCHRKMVCDLVRRSLPDAEVVGVAPLTSQPGMLRTVEHRERRRTCQFQYNGTGVGQTGKPCANLTHWYIMPDDVAICRTCALYMADKREGNKEVLAPMLGGMEANPVPHTLELE